MSRNVQAIIWIMLTGFLSVTIYMLARQLGARFHPTQVVFFYSFVGMVCFLPVILMKRISLRTEQGAMYAVRAVLEFSAFSLSFAAIAYLPLSVHSALAFTSPLFGCLLAVIVLKEPLRVHSVVALVAGFLGVLIITRPDAYGVSSAALWVLVSSFLFAFCSMCIKSLTKTESSECIAFYMLFGTTLVAAPIAFSHEWKASVMEHLPMIGLLGLLVAGVQFTVAQAFSKAAVTLILPFFFLNLLWSSLYGYFIFDEIVSGWTVLGAAFIIGGAIYAAYHASRAERVVMKDAEQAILGS